MRFKQQKTKNKVRESHISLLNSTILRSSTQFYKKTHGNPTFVGGKRELTLSVFENKRGIKCGIKLFRHPPFFFDVVSHEVGVRVF